MKDYGMFVADNGSPWYISGAPDERWDNDLLHTMDPLLRRRLRGRRRIRPDDRPQLGPKQVEP